MLKKLPGLIWTSAIVAYLIKRFGPDDLVGWAKSITNRGGALVGEAPGVTTIVRDAVEATERDGQLAEAVDIGTSVLGTPHVPAG
jgi:hypothetical protein